MLPLEKIFLIPSLLIVPVVLLLFALLRRRFENYLFLWFASMLACFLLCGLFLVQVGRTPLYSQRSHSPRNPGGASASVSTGIAVLLVETCVVIPAFPLLVGLSLLPPRGWKLSWRIVMVITCVAYILTLVLLLLQRSTAYNRDYEETRQQRFQTTDQFEHLRRP